MSNNDNNGSTKNVRVYWPSVYSYSDSSNIVTPWNKCLLNHHSIDNTIGYIRIEFDRQNGILLLSNPSEPQRLSSTSNQIETFTTIFAHPKTCPFYTLLNSNSQLHKQLQQNINSYSHAIKVGVSVLIEDVFGRVFLTRRARTMRIFPGVWVLPGGHMERGETIIQTALRELREETGLVMSDSEHDISVIGAFESTYPQFLADDKLPSDHHVVLFTKIKLHSDISHIQKVDLEPDEVDIAAWVPISSLAHLLADTGKDFELHKHNYQSLYSDSDSLENDFESFYPAVSINKNNQDFNLKQSFIDKTESIPAATTFILKQYLNSKVVEQQNKKSK